MDKPWLKIKDRKRKTWIRCESIKPFSNEESLEITPTVPLNCWKCAEYLQFSCCCIQCVIWRIMLQCAESNTNIPLIPLPILTSHFRPKAKSVAHFLALTWPSQHGGCWRQELVCWRQGPMMLAPDPAMRDTREWEDSGSKECCKTAHGSQTMLFQVSSDLKLSWFQGPA